LSVSRWTKPPFPKHYAKRDAEPFNVPCNLSRKHQP
jgi:hypothetical protein